MRLIHVDDDTQQIIGFCIFQELKRAKKKHPDYVTDIVDMAAVVSEEAGEAIRESLRVKYEDGSVKALKEELIQTASSCIRMLEALENGAASKYTSKN